MRVDIARSEADTAPWPRWCFTADQFRSLTESIIANASSPKHKGVYPISLWLLPAGSQQAEKVIELFRKLPEDAGLWRKILDLGVMRIAIFDAYCDLMTNQSEARQVTRWMRNAAEQVVDMDVEWEIEGPP